MSIAVATPYGPVAEALFQRAARVRLLVCDVDGVLSDGKIYLGNQGEELKTFHTKDGFGIKALLVITSYSIHYTKLYDHHHRQRHHPAQGTRC